MHLIRSIRSCKFIDEVAQNLRCGCRGLCNRCFLSSFRSVWSSSVSAFGSLALWWSSQLLLIAYSSGGCRFSAPFDCLAWRECAWLSVLVVVARSIAVCEISLLDGWVCGLGEVCSDGMLLYLCCARGVDEFQEWPFGSQRGGWIRRERLGEQHVCCFDPFLPLPTSSNFLSFPFCLLESSAFSPPTPGASLKYSSERQPCFHW